jgi:hypothetical protein
MPNYTITLTAEQDAALDILISRLAATGATYTKASYVQERAMGVVNSYVAQMAAEEAQKVAEAYKQASAAEQASVKSTLKVG